MLDLGTGTGVLPHNMYRYGAHWTGTDILPEQIEAAKRLADAAGMKIDFQAVPSEEIDFPKESFDVTLSVNIAAVTYILKLCPYLSLVFRKKRCP